MHLLALRQLMQLIGVVLCRKRPDFALAPSHVIGHVVKESLKILPKSKLLSVNRPLHELLGTGGHVVLKRVGWNQQQKKKQ